MPLTLQQSKKFIQTVHEEFKNGHFGDWWFCRDTDVAKAIARQVRELAEELHIVEPTTEKHSCGHEHKAQSNVKAMGNVYTPDYKKALAIKVIDLIKGMSMNSMFRANGTPARATLAALEVQAKISEVAIKVYDYESLVTQDQSEIKDLRSANKNKTHELEVLNAKLAHLGLAYTSLEIEHNALVKNREAYLKTIPTLIHQLEDYKKNHHSQSYAHPNMLTSLIKAADMVMNAHNSNEQNISDTRAQRERCLLLRSIENQEKVIALEPSEGCVIEETKSADLQHESQLVHCHASTFNKSAVIPSAPPAEAANNEEIETRRSAKY
ncbi:MAG: hypothetical protein P1U34_05695 [Coxiellaceae bacterium]|nr:hypothetical protein [Coxiellaceae bacterium]